MLTSGLHSTHTCLCLGISYMSEDSHRNIPPPSPTYIHTHTHMVLKNGYFQKRISSSCQSQDSCVYTQNEVGNSHNYPDDFHQNILVTEISRTLKISYGSVLHLGLEFPDNCSISQVLFRLEPQPVHWQ